MEPNVPPLVDNNDTIFRVPDDMNIDEIIASCHIDDNRVGIPHVVAMTFAAKKIITKSMHGFWFREATAKAQRNGVNMFASFATMGEVFDFAFHIRWADNIQLDEELRKSMIAYCGNLRRRRAPYEVVVDARERTIRLIPLNIIE